MRTTVNLPDDVYEAARNTKKAFPCFNVPPGAKPITLEQTLAAEDDL